MFGRFTTVLHTAFVLSHSNGFVSVPILSHEAGTASHPAAVGGGVTQVGLNISVFVVRDGCGTLSEACISVVDGRRILCNGKHVAAALKRVHSQIMEVEACPPKETWLVPELERVFKEGLRVDVLEYPTDDRTHFHAIQCLAHEAEQNKFAPTSLKDKANLVLRMHTRSTGGDWAQTQRALVEILGATKRTTVFRWVVIARDFDAEVLAYLGPRCKNKYLVGRGEERTHRYTDNRACMHTHTRRQEV